MTPRKPSRARRVIEGILLLAGMLGIGIWAGSYVIPAFWQDWENFSFDRQLVGQPVNLGIYAATRAHEMKEDIGYALGLTPHRTNNTSREGPSGASTNTNAISKNGVIGRLSIPRLAVRGIVREGVDDTTLSLALGHIPGTAFPGEKGSVGVAGHRDRLFSGLRGIRTDDRIQLETTEKRYVYQVASTQIVKPEDVAVLQAVHPYELTLVTCYPFNYIGSAPYRFIVKATAVDSTSTTDPVIANTSYVAAVHSPQVVTSPGAADASNRPAKHVNNENGNENGGGFNIPTNQSRQLAPGISMGVTDTNVSGDTVNGWMWVMPDRRTIWLRSQKTHDPLVFYRDGKRQELLITKIKDNSVSGYLLSSPDQSQ